MTLKSTVILIFILISILNGYYSQLFPDLIPSPPLYKLTKLNVDPKQVTFSGFSSGGAQTMQFHVAHSSKLLGVGIFSGVPYMSGYDRNREDFFVHEANFNVTQLTQFARNFAEENLVDDTSNLKGSRVYIYHGKRDTTVHPGCGSVMNEFYKVFDSEILYHGSTIDSEHGMPSDNSGGPCTLINLANSLINNCGYSGVYEMFNYLYRGNLIKPNGTVGSVNLDYGQFLKFDQAEFFPNNKPQPASMDNIGFIYIPSGCNQILNQTCRLNFALHGCTQDRFNYGDRFPKATGYLETAELNNIITVFPQVAPSWISPRNPQSCWDWWGFTSKLFATREGKQVRALKSMLDRILGEENVPIKL